MAFSIATKFVAVAGTTAAIITPVVLTTVPVAPYNSQKTYQTSTDLQSLKTRKVKCYEISTKENAAGKLLICNNQKYYLQNLNDNILTELEDLKTMSGGKISSKLVNKEPEVRQIWEILDPKWKTLSEGIPLKIKHYRNNPNGKCSLENTTEDEKTVAILSCEERKWYPVSIKLITLEVEENLVTGARRG